MKSIKWDKLRILVTNHCNYRCPFCHNEGQEKAERIGMMSIASFKQLIGYMDGQNLSEINFSGGEPFLHKGLVDMIIYADKYMACDISCSTNLSLITDEQIIRLAKTRVKFNIQFPFISEEDFANSTGGGKLYNILDRIKAVKSAGIEIGLNTVIQSANNDAIKQMIQFSLENELPLKLLPQIGLSGSDRFLYNIQPMLKKYAVDFVNKGTGALKWTIQNTNHQTSVLYINSPCFSQDITACRNYGEIRIQPDFRVRCCIMKKASEQLCLEKGKEFVINQFARLWNDFNQC
jgi:cyclic pyranopterin phosphate synthase